MNRSRKLSLALVVAAAVSLVLAAGVKRGEAGEPISGYKVLSPLSHGNLTIFPVVAESSHDTHSFLTLDEGLRSGEVVVTEEGRVQGLRRRRPHPAQGRAVPWEERPFPYGGSQGAEVNRLVLVNNSDRPLILLAGEIVSGGKQDRVVSKDRIVAPKSDPIDLSVFCVEPHRWVETASRFSGVGAAIAQPSVRKKVMTDKNQQQVWAEVGKSLDSLAKAAPAAAGRALQSTSSYAVAVDNQDVKRQLDDVAAPIARSYESLMRELRARNAAGAVVAVNGQIIWADVFASTALLEKYWPKLIRSYAAEAVTNPAPVVDAERRLSVKAAQAFLDDFRGRRESVESEPEIYRHTEISGDGFTAFKLTALLPNTGFDIHIAKVAD